MSRPPKSAVAPAGCITFTQYAALADVSPAAVTKAVKTGRLTESVVTDEDGRRWIDPVKADAEWLANTGPTQPNGRSYRKPAVVQAATQQRETSDQPQVTDADRQPAADTTDLFEARRRKEVYTAELKRLELLEREGQMVAIADVRDTVAAEYTRLRQRLLAIPGKAAQEVLGVDDAAEAARVIDAYIVEALTELSEGHGHGDRPEAG